MFWCSSDAPAASEIFHTACDAIAIFVILVGRVSLTEAEVADDGTGGNHENGHN